MTRVKFNYDRNAILGFSMKGHAGFNKKGPDILCASLSATSQMTVNGVLDWLGLDADDVVLESDAVKGVMVVKIPEGLHDNLGAQVILHTFELFIEELSEMYSEYVSIERSYEDDNKVN